MNPTAYSTAWEHPQTRNAWRRQTFLIPCKLFGWIACCIATIVITVGFISPTWVIFSIPLLAYSAIRAIVQIGLLTCEFSSRRILKVYPWQILRDTPRSRAKHPEASREGMWIGFNNPGAKGEVIPLVFIKQARTHWWYKRIGGPTTDPSLTAQLDPLWFAGDPRFVGVVAASDHSGTTPKRMHVLYQPHAMGRGKQKWSATHSDLERAKRAGAVVPGQGSVESIRE